MKAKQIMYLAMFFVAAVLLVSCDRLPRDAERAVMRNFELEERARLLSVRQVDLLPEDEAGGVEEVWCVNIAYVCWSCDYGQYITCSSSWFVSRFGDMWQVAGVGLEQDWERWEAQGCPVEDPVVSMNAPNIGR